MAGAAAGSVIGHGISNVLFGGSRSSEVDSHASGAGAAGAAGAHPCSQINWEFRQCMDQQQQGGDLNACNGIFDALKSCERQNGPM